jgi:hypothetical protein
MSTHFKFVVSLSVGLLILFGWHFSTVFGFLGTAPITQTEFFIRIGSIALVFIIISVITSIMVAKKDERAVFPDEREEKIELKTDRIGAISLYIGLMIVMWLVFTPLTPMQVANALLAVVCITEIIKLTYGLFLLKTGA